MTPDQARDYQSQLGSEFNVPGACTLRLENVLVHEDACTEGFALHFTGPREVLLPQGIRRLIHPALGEMDLFLVPVRDPRMDRYTYEAIFNRLKPRPAVQGGV